MNNRNHLATTGRFSRREFLKRSSVIAAAGVAAPTMLDLSTLGASDFVHAAATDPRDYRALVCVFMYGGNDHNDTIIPYDFQSHAAYTSLRPALSRQRSTLLELGADRFGERSVAFTPEWAGLKNLYDRRDLAVLANVGTLKTPTTKASFEKRSDRPAQLFSHNDQQSTWKTSKPEGATDGWVGRLGDLLMDSNGENSVFTSISTGGNSVMMTGRHLNQYQVDPRGVTRLNATYGSSEVLRELQNIMGNDPGGLFPSAHTTAAAEALDSGGRLNDALSGATFGAVDFPSTRLARQLKMVARLIDAGKNQLGLRRQVFFVSGGGFDTHQKQVALRGSLLSELDGALTSFHDSLVATGAIDQVTAFTASDFGRTLTSNVDGSDHGWGSHHIILGGAVRGGKIYGRLPEVADDGPDDVGRGRLIPTTSVDQYSATLATWMGAEESQMDAIAPYLDRFGAADLGFMESASAPGGSGGSGSGSGGGWRGQGIAHGLLKPAKRKSAKQDK